MCGYVVAIGEGNDLASSVRKSTEITSYRGPDETTFYNNLNDLVEKIIFYKKNDKIRKKIAYNGRKKYFKLFSEVKTAKYIIDTSIGKKVNLY